MKEIEDYIEEEVDDYVRTLLQIADVVIDNQFVNNTSSYTGKFDCILTAYVWTHCAESLQFVEQEFPEDWYDEHGDFKYEIPCCESIYLEAYESSIFIEKRYVYVHQNEQGFVSSVTFDQEMKQVWFLDGHDCPTFEWKPVD